ncbi:MAG: Flagellar assembly protein FliX [Alphaproteobacteria bacterium MarineAlpha3_Bin5]|nr:MAG: Flagellar assembly protein FliX [Alphaproteobacteria bacterium MarineAlpha3_Bin5]
MKVSKTGATTKGSKTEKKKVPRNGTDFIRNLEELQGIDNSGRTVETGAVGPVAAAFSLQEVEDTTVHSSRSDLIVRSSDLLDQLEIIRIGFLAGAIPKERITELARKLRQKRAQSDDPRLNKIIDEIELRAEVEIAKLSRPIK